jgi:hypothetical protein
VRTNDKLRVSEGERERGGEGERDRRRGGGGEEGIGTIFWVLLTLLLVLLTAYTAYCLHCLLRIPWRAVYECIVYSVYRGVYLGVHE